MAAMLTPMHLAICERNVEVVKELIAADAQSIHQNVTMHALFNTNLIGLHEDQKTLRIFNMTQVNVFNTLIGDEWTTLEVAFATENMEIVRLLLDAGAQFAAPREFQIAIIMGNSRLARLALNQLEANFNLNPILGFPVMQLFSLTNFLWNEASLDLIRAAVERGCNLNDVNQEGVHLPPFIHSFMQRVTNERIFNVVVAIEHLDLNISYNNMDTILTILLRQYRETRNLYFIKQLILNCVDASAAPIGEYMLTNLHPQVELIKLLYRAGGDVGRHFVSPVPPAGLNDLNREAYLTLHNWFIEEKGQGRTLKEWARIGARKVSNIRQEINSTTFLPTFRSYIRFEAEVESVTLNDVLFNDLNNVPLLFGQLEFD